MTNALTSTPTGCLEAGLGKEMQRAQGIQADWIAMKASLDEMVLNGQLDVVRPGHRLQ
jgi:hypothetical protein